MQTLARCLDRLDDHFRWARFEQQKLTAVGSDPRPFADLEQNAQDNVELSRDPAKGGKPDPKSIEEAAVGTLAEHLGVLDEVRREKTGSSEFVDSSGACWDVKSPVSPDRPGWLFDPYHHVAVVQEDLAHGEGILLDLSRLNRTDANSLLGQLAVAPVDRGKLLILLDESLVSG